MSKRNIYLALTALFLILIVAIQSLSEEIAPGQQELKLDLDQRRLLTSPFLIPTILFSLIYILIFLIGTLQIFYFLIAKILRRQTVLSRDKTKAVVVLSEETASKILCLTSFSVLLFYLIPTFLYLFKYLIPAVTLLLLLNMLLEIVVISILLSHINWKTLGFQIKKSHLLFLLRLYSAMLPFLFMAMLANSFVLKKLGIEYESSEVIELLFSIKNPLLLAILILQIIALGPLAEELFFRGFLFSLLRTRYAFTLSASLISFFFSLLHRTPGNILPLFVISFSLCYSYEKTQNIAVVTIFHALHNSISLIGFFLIQNLISY